MGQYRFEHAPRIQDEHRYLFIMRNGLDNRQMNERDAIVSPNAGG